MTSLYFKGRNIIVPYGPKWCVYFHRVAGEVVYVGKGHADRPFRQAGRNRGRHWHWLMAQYGSFEVEIVEWYDTNEEATAVETDLIKELKPKCNLLHNGYETTPKQKAAASRASKGRRVSEAAKARISVANSGNKFCAGRVLSEETKQKIAAAVKANGHKVRGPDGRMVRV